MKVKYMLLVAGLSLPLLAQAHDPKEHMKDAEKPDCAAMNNMDHSKMDRNDPVMQAMMKKCMKAMHKDEAESHEAHGDKGQTDHGNHDEKADEKKPAKHQHKK